MPAQPFRLATLLKLREATRDERRRDLAQALEALRMVEEQQAELRREREDARGLAQRWGQPGAIDVDTLLDGHRYQLQLELRGQILARQMRQIADEVERRRLALVEADRQVRALEKLRERQAERARLAAERGEVRRLDEVAGMRALRLREEPA